MSAEFRLVFVRVVEPLYSIVRELALIHTTHLTLCSLAHLMLVLELRGRTTLVFVRVEKRTVLMVMLVSERTWLSFEEI